MSNKINPSEVSSVLLKELEGLKTDMEFEEVGKVLNIPEKVCCAIVLLSE